jgi:NAD-dependent deacetylase
VERDVAGSTSDVAALAELVRSAGSVVALTGAGISVPSGIPDFRTPGTGLWENVDPMEVAHIDAWHANPERFWSFYGDRFQTLGDKAPNGAHHALVELERRGRLDAVITQNIDMLHRRAGTVELVEVHGSIATCSCLACGERVASSVVVEQLSTASVPLCGCGRPRKPDVVLFGEFLPEAALERATQLAEAADLLLCVGSSLEVYPVAQLPGITLRHGGAVAIVTQGPTPYDARASVRCGGDVEAELQALVAALGDESVSAAGDRRLRERHGLGVDHHRDEQ